MFQSLTLKIPISHHSHLWYFDYCMVSKTMGQQSSQHPVQRTYFNAYKWFISVLAIHFGKYIKMDWEKGNENKKNIKCYHKMYQQENLILDVL